MDTPESLQEPMTTTTGPSSTNDAGPAPKADKPRKITAPLIVVIFLCLLVLVLFRIGAITLVLTALFVFLDAWHAGIHKTKGSTSFFNISPAAWAAAILLLFVVAYPLYAFKRQSLKTTPGRFELFIIANIFGVATIAMIGIGLLVAFAGITR